MKTIMATARRGVLLACLGSSMASGQPGGTVGPVGGGLMPYEQKIADAARIENPALREVALRQAIEEGLLKEPYNVSYEVVRYLGANDRWIDLRPFEDILVQYHGGSPHDNGGERWVQEIKWRYLSRADRLRVCRAAIEQGRAVAPGARPVPRDVAIQSIGTYGLAELVPLVEEYYPALPKEQKETLSLAQLRIEANLKDGCEGREDCFDRAAQRLAAMSDEAFKKKMDGDKAFGDVVLGFNGVVRFVCERNPFNGWVNPGCQRIHGIYERQAALDKKINAERAAEGTQPQARPPEPLRETWLQRLRELSAYDARYPKRH
jgi:hypothetical protein